MKNQPLLSYRFLILLIDGLLPVVPALVMIHARPELTLIHPWPLVLSLLGAHLLLMLLAWRRIGSKQRQREAEAGMLLITAFIPWVTYGWLFPQEGALLSLPVQVLIYCLGQVVWIVSVEVAPCWIGRLRQRKAEERALSGKSQFLLREEVLRNREKRGK